MCRAVAGARADIAATHCRVTRALGAVAACEMFEGSGAGVCPRETLSHQLGAFGNSKQQSHGKPLILAFFALFGCAAVVGSAFIRISRERTLHASSRMLGPDTQDEELLCEHFNSLSDGEGPITGIE
eukprot:NODE_24114_length_637_cov_7.503922.p4 GENE.NODE_24114_length_637_cov_7.503922~~NODE_24114_length_637_cov_7.503922.p4  ORF type:complete len:127 (-),score=39.15 NODE_24114_length_637_cov_7.503922:209-589(-)